MAGVGTGTGALNSLLGKLAGLLGDEFMLLKNVRKEVEFLERELRRVQSVLVTLADMRTLAPHEKDWKDNLRELSYDMEYCIDRFVDRLGGGRADTMRAGFVKKTARRLRTIWKRHDLATELKHLKARVMEESQRRERYQLDRSLEPKGPIEIDPRLPALHAEAKGLMAIDGPRDRVVSWLGADQGAELKVVAIVGGGGLGKTTLAMEVYRKIGGDFEVRASAAVSRALDLDKLLKDILPQINRAAFSKCQSERWEQNHLIRQIREILTGKRYFIVIDDVWKKEDWDYVKAAFPDNHNGSRIIATTRITSVANSCCSNSGDQVYKMEPLNAVDSQRLFTNRIFGSENSFPPQLENVSARILKKCGGLPLAIITIASLLASKPQCRKAWEGLEDSIGIGCSHENANGLKGMIDILSLSYWDLPQQMKTCLLYLCIYPEDYRVSCEELKHKWIAEGFIATQGGNLGQEAKNCFNELVNRNMIQLVDVPFPKKVYGGYFEDEGVKYCQVHDMVLDLIISLSKEDNFATISNGRVSNAWPSKIRRLSMQSAGQEHKGAIRAITESKLHVRSLNVFGETEQIPPLVDFQAMRVLDFENCKSLQNKHIKNIGSLTQLRYLRIHGWGITKVPEEIGKLQYLETLDLRECFRIETLPSSMGQLSKLVRLFVNRNVTLPADVIRSMHALEEVSEISDVDNELKFAEELMHLTKLRKLTIHLKRPPRPVLEILESSVSELGKHNLRYLHTSADLGEYLFRNPCGTFPHLQDLKILFPMRSVPKGMAPLDIVVKLDIEVLTFDEEGLHLLMGMSSLSHLDLRVWDMEKKLTVGCDGFKLLKVFNCINWGVGIAFAPGAMPALQRLHLYWIVRDRDGIIVTGIEHLSGLTHLQVTIGWSNATPDHAEAVMGSIEKTVALHPNRHTLQVCLDKKL